VAEIRNELGLSEGKKAIEDEKTEDLDYTHVENV
jgi:hypothetical protein